MNKEEVLNKLIPILEEELKIDSVSETTSQDGTPEWDSMTYLSIVSRLEEEFNIEVSPDNISNFSSVDLIIQEILN